ncbi:hypothetical protein DMENIID0001_029330 [Sergentomyia squamirostris]
MSQNLNQTLRQFTTLVLLLLAFVGEPVNAAKTSRVSRRLEACCYYVSHGEYPDYITYYTPEELNEYKLWDENDEDIVQICGLETVEISRPRTSSKENSASISGDTMMEEVKEKPEDHGIDEKPKVKNSIPKHITVEPKFLPEESYNLENILSCKLVKQVTVSVNFHVSVNPHTGSIEIMHVGSGMKR